jgi:hypothetical protein
MMFPTSATTALMFELPSWLAAGLEWLLFALLFAVVYCLWEMLLSTLLGRRPTRSRWIVLLISGVLLGLAPLAESLWIAPARFNGDVETLWGFVLSPWLLLAFLACGSVLVVLRIADATKLGSLAGIPAVVWWVSGCLVVSVYGVAAAWSNSGLIVSAEYVAPILAAGFGLAVAGVGSLVFAAWLKWSRRVTAV